MNQEEFERMLRRRIEAEKAKCEKAKAEKRYDDALYHTGVMHGYWDAIRLSWPQYQVSL